jgi:hypothetical protein
MFTSLTKTQLRSLKAKLEHAHGTWMEAYGWDTEVGGWEELHSLHSEVVGEYRTRLA